MSNTLLVALSPKPSAARTAQVALQLAQTLRYTPAAVAVKLHKGPATLEHISPRLRVNFPTLDALKGLGSDQALEGYIATAPNVVDGILHSVQKLNPTLLVMGTQGREGLSRLLEGSVAEGVLKRCPVPVMLLRQRTAADMRGLEHVLVAVDREPGCEVALEAAVRLCQRTGARLTLLHVLVGISDAFRAVYGGHPAPDAQRQFAEWRNRATQVLERLKNWAHELDGPSVRLETALVETYDSSVSSLILTYALEHGVDLLALSTSSKTGLDRLLLGSVAEGVFHRAEIPVLMLGPVTLGPATGRGDLINSLEPAREDRRKRSQMP